MINSISIAYVLEFGTQNVEERVYLLNTYRS
jgi:hypothetical protein